MEVKHIKGYSIGKLRVYDLVALVKDDQCMIIRPDVGTTIGIKKDMLETIEKHSIKESLAFLMVQRGLASFDKSREVYIKSETVRPDFFLIDLTKRCNLACKYCFRGLEEDYPEMKIEMIDKICDSLISYWKKNLFLNLTIQAWGGEPLICLQLIIRIRENFNKANLFPQIVMETNATMITLDIAKKLKENNILLGISIDGTKEVHNLQRPFIDGSGTLDKVEKGIENIRLAMGDGFGSITVVTKNTIKNLSKIIDYFVSLNMKSVKFNMMRKNEKNLDLALDFNEFDSYIDELLNCIFILYKNKIKFIEQNISQRMINLVYRPNNNICNAHGCRGGYRMLSIDSLGNVPM